MYLRVREDGHIVVTANRLIPKKTVDAFVLKNGRFIEKRLQELQQRKEKAAPVYNRARLLEARAYLMPIVDRVYARFRAANDPVPYPKVTVRVMKTRWGSCTASKGHISLNARLTEVPYESAEYVIVHEFAHFLEQNHSADFWNVVARYLPDYKIRKKGLKQVL